MYFYFVLLYYIIKGGVLVNIGEIIKNERKKKNLTQKELAEKINKSERMMQKYENNEVTPSIEVLTKIAAALDVTFNDLITNTDMVNLSTADSDTQFMYTEFLGSDPDFNIIRKTIESMGYSILYNIGSKDVTIVKNDKSSAATIPENKFVELGKEMINHINEFTQFEVRKFIDNLDFLYGETIEKE